MTSPHFAWLPPETNSALIFAGPGAGPLLAAATAWDNLAEELASSASSFFAVTSDLANGWWQGASAGAMMNVATQYVSWLSAAAAQAESAAGQAAAIAAAFETALAATVQPAVVAANRALVQALAATNWFGFNIPAIMDTEAAYEQMWAADVAAMFAYYADASAAAAKLAPWQQAPNGPASNFSKGHQLSGAPVGTDDSVKAHMSASGSAPLSPPVGPGNAGSNNIGLGNTGNNNVGFGNTGNYDFGIGLTGDNQFGFGGFNSGTGNVGLFNSGSGNVGLFNSGTGNFGIGNAGVSNMGLANSGSLNAGIFNTGTANTGLFQDNGLGGAASGALSSASYVTGGVGAANLSSGLLNSVTASTGGLGLPSQGFANPTPSSPAYSGQADSGGMSGGVVSAGPNGGASAAGSTPIPPALRTTTSAPAGFVAAGGNDSGLRNLPTRESGIANSSFFNRGDRNPQGPNPGIQLPDPIDD